MALELCWPVLWITRDEFAAKYGLDSTAAPAPVSGEHVHFQAESPAAACGTTGHPRAV